MRSSREECSGSLVASVTWRLAGHGRCCLCAASRAPGPGPRCQWPRSTQLEPAPRKGPTRDPQSRWTLALRPLTLGVDRSTPPPLRRVD
eukprot:450674-Rhodomonas_salina.2